MQHKFTSILLVLEKGRQLPACLKINRNIYSHENRNKIDITFDRNYKYKDIIQQRRNNTFDVYKNISPAINLRTNFRSCLGLVRETKESSNFATLSF